MEYICKRVTNKQARLARERAESIIKDVRKSLKSNFKFAHRLVGSGKWGTSIEDPNGEYDLDYQLTLTTNSKEYKENKLSNPTKIKEDFFNAFSKCANKDETIENSKTAITLINKNKTKKFHIDFVILRIYPEAKEIIRRNNDTYNKTINHYTWNQLETPNKAYAAFKHLSSEEKEDLIVNYIIPKKFKEKSKRDDDPSKISSCEVFVREVNNYVAKRNNK